MLIKMFLLFAVAVIFSVKQNDISKFVESQHVCEIILKSE